MAKPKTKQLAPASTETAIGAGHRQSAGGRQGSAKNVYNRSFPWWPLFTLAAMVALIVVCLGRVPGLISKLANRNGVVDGGAAGYYVEGKAVGTFDVQTALVFFLAQDGCELRAYVDGVAAVV